jgi:hypothetical protein
MTSILGREALENHLMDVERALERATKHGLTAQKA